MEAKTELLNRVIAYYVKTFFLYLPTAKSRYAHLKFFLTSNRYIEMDFRKVYGTPTKNYWLGQEI